MKLVIIPLLLIGMFIISLSYVNSLESLGTFADNSTVRITQVCSDATYINISSVSYPNSTVAVSNIEMTSAGSGEYYYDFILTQDLGRYDVRGVSDGCEKTFATYFDITLTGKETPAGMPTLQGALMLVIFGVACFMLFLSMKSTEVAPKIFFLIGSFIFLMASMLTGYIVTVDYNVSESLSTATMAVVFSLGMILIVVFGYTMIRQTVSILDMYKVNRGLEWGGVGRGMQTAGHNPNQFM